MSPQKYFTRSGIWLGPTWRDQRGPSGDQVKFEILFFDWNINVHIHTHTPNSRLNFFWVLFTHGFWNFSPIRICILCSFRVSFSYFVTLASSQKNQFCCFFLLLEVARNQIWKEWFIQMNTCKPSRSLLRYINMLMSKLYLFTFPSCSALAFFGSVLDILFFIKVFVKNYKTLSVQFTVFPPLFFQYFYSLI